jgi:hypothetical protein
MIAAGVVLAFAAAVVPHYAAGYRLLVDVLLIGLLPYLVYLVFSELVRGRLLPWVGIALFAADLAVKLPARYLHADGYPGAMVYLWPLVAAFVVLPVLLGPAAWRRVRRERQAATPPDR